MVKEGGLDWIYNRNGIRHLNDEMLSDVVLKCGHRCRESCRQKSYFFDDIDMQRIG